MATFKFCTLPEVPLFDHKGIQLNNSWREIDLDKLDADGRDALELYVGRIVQVHPMDQDAYVAFTGLALENGTFVAASGEPAVGARHAIGFRKPASTDAPKEKPAARTR